MKLFEHRLIEGKVYDLSNFTVGRKLKSYMACRNRLIIFMGRQTVLDEISDGSSGSSIPLHSFEFVDFRECSS
jgi:replication factor A1